MKKVKSSRKLPKRMYLKHGSYYFVQPKTEKWIKLDDNYSKALNKYYELVEAPSLSNKMSEIMDRYMVEIAPTKALSTYRDNLREIGNLRKVFADMTASDIKPHHIYKYLDIRAKQATVRANREKALLSHIFSMAIKWGILDSNPCRDVKRLKETPRDRYVSDKEYLAVHELASPIIKVIMDFSYLTGKRLGDVLKVKLSDITWGECVRFEISKVRKRSQVDWSPDLESVISAAKNIKRTVRSIYLFANKKGQQYSSDGFSTIWQKLMRKALESGAIIERFTFHDLRAKTASDATSLEHARQLLDHSTTRTTTRVYMRKTQIVSPLARTILDSNPIFGQEDKRVKVK